MYIFDSHTYVKKLVDAGCPEEQAEVQAEELKKLIASDLVTKKDLESGLAKTEAKILATTKKDLELGLAKFETKILAATKKDLAETEAKILATTKKDLRDTETKILKETELNLAKIQVKIIFWVVGCFFAQTGFLFTLFQFFR